MPKGKEALLYQEVGRRIKKLRNQLQMKQEDLAERVGLSRASIVNIENGRHRAHLFTLYNLASALRCPLLELLPPLGDIAHELPGSFDGKIKASEKGAVAQLLSQAKLGEK